MEKVLRYIDQMSIWSGKISSWLIIPLIAIVAYDVIARKFYRATIWAYDSALWVYAGIFLIGLAWVLKEHSHIRVDVIYERHSPRAKALFEVLSYLIFFFPLTITLLISGAAYAVESWIDKEVSIYSPWNPLLWHFKTIAPIAFLLLLLQGIADFIRNLKFMIRKGGVR